MDSYAENRAMQCKLKHSSDDNRSKNGDSGDYIGGGQAVHQAAHCCANFMRVDAISLLSSPVANTQTVS
jgi:hypothetical protein